MPRRPARRRWRKSSKFLEDGVMQNTAYRFYRQVQENTAAKYMPGILASAVEFCESVPCRSTQAADLSRLHSAVKSEFVKNQGDQNNDIMKVKTLLYAHLMREPIPASLQADLNLVLEHAHRLLNGLLNICMEQARRRTLHQPEGPPFALRRPPFRPRASRRSASSRARST